MHSGHDNHNAEESIKAGYEVTDLHAGVVVLTLAALALMAVGSIVFIIIFQRGFDRSMQPMNTGERSPLAVMETVVPLDGPRLQMDPVADKRAYFAEAQGHLDSAGYVSREPGMERVHIPIEAAMTLVAEGKVPYRQAPVVAEEPGEE